MTNFERIKAMSLDEMAEVMAKEGCFYCEYATIDDCGGWCKEGFRKWLESEVTENESN